MDSRKLISVGVASLCATFLFLLVAYSAQKWGPMGKFRDAGLVVGIEVLGGGSILGSYDDHKANAKTWSLLWLVLFNPGLIVGMALGTRYRKILLSTALSLPSIIIALIASKVLASIIFSALRSHGFQSHPYPLIENDIYVIWLILAVGAIPLGLAGAVCGSLSPTNWIKRQPANHSVERPAAQ